MPILSVEGKTVLFIHVPKTGGRAVEAHIKDHGSVCFEHTLGRELGLKCIPMHFHGAVLESLFDPSLFDHAFMVVRHPVARAVSDFRYFVRRRKLVDNPPNFTRWLRYRLFRAQRNPYYMDNHFRPQWEFECFDSAVYRLEDGLETAVKDMNAKLGTTIPEQLPRVNEGAAVEVDVRDADRDLIYSRYAQDFERFGYQKD
jgi:hypothetical protein